MNRIRFALPGICCRKAFSRQKIPGGLVYEIAFLSPFYPFPYIFYRDNWDTLKNRAARLAVTGFLLSQSRRDMSRFFWDNPRIMRLGQG